MATTYTTYLRLRIADSLTADSKYNLQQIDSLASRFVIAADEDTLVRSVHDISIVPESLDVGGSGSGGTVTLGEQRAEADLPDLIDMWTKSVRVSSPVSFRDQASPINGSSAYLAVSYKSDVAGSKDTTNRTLALDVQGANRTVALGGNVLTSADLTTTGGAAVLAWPVLGATATIPATGTVVMEAFAQTLTNKTFDADANSLSNVRNVNVAANAAIDYSKLNLALSIVNADVSPSAAIERSKIAVGTANHVLINSGTGALSSEAQLDRTRGGTGVSSTATFPTSGVVVTEAGAATLTNKTMSGAANTFSNIGYSSLVLTNSILNADVANGAGIVYSKLDLANSILNADINATAAIALSKLAALTANRAVVTSGAGVLTVSAATDTEVSYLSGVTSAIQTQVDAKLNRSLNNVNVSGLTLGDILYASSGTALTRVGIGTAGQVLQVVGGVPAWASVSGTGDVVGPASSTDNALARFDGTTGKLIKSSPGSIANADVDAAAAIAYSKLALSNSIVNADINASAAIAYSKLALTGAILNADLAGSIDATKIADGSVTSTEFQYLGGVTSDIQTQLNGKEPTQTKGSISTSSAGVTVGSGANSTVGPNVTVDVAAATTSVQGLMSAADKTKIDALTLPQAPTVNRLVWVSQAGDDGTGDGTYNKPWATVSYALSQISDASTTKRYGIKLMPGTITESAANLELKPWVWIQGDAWGTSRINVTGGSQRIVLGSGFASGSSRAGLHNVYLTGSTSIYMDFVTLAASGSVVMEFQDIGVNGSFTQLSNNTNQYMQVRGSLIFGNMQVSGAGGFCFDSFIVGTLTVDTATSVNVPGFEFAASTVGSTTSLASTGANTANLNLYASSLLGAVTTSGSGTTLYSDVSSVPLSLTIGSGVTFTRRSDAFALAYTPTTAGDWSPAPTEVRGALDQLADRVETLETSPAYQTYKTDWVTADTATKVITHSLNSLDVAVQIYDKANGATIDIDSTVRTDVNTVTVTASEAPNASGWRVMIWKV